MYHFTHFYLFSFLSFVVILFLQIGGGEVNKNKTFLQI